jgi:catechol 2,3-dioxygenase-like lactoylglutathione lyase family enzyme
MSQSAIEFPTPTRIHIALGVRDVDAARVFYETLFGQPATKVRDGYAKFEVHDPPVNLSLNRDPQATAPRAPRHYGIQVKSTDAVLATRRRLEAGGIATEVEDQVACCYAVQDKAWATDPDGHQWEIFVVTHAEAETYARMPAGAAAAGTAAPSEERSCCGPECCT